MLKKLIDLKLYYFTVLSFGGRGGIRTHVPYLGNLISSQARYGHFDTSPVPIYYTMVLMEFQILFYKYFTNTEKGISTLRNWENSLQ